MQPGGVNTFAVEAGSQLLVQRFAVQQAVRLLHQLQVIHIPCIMASLDGSIWQWYFPTFSHSQAIWCSVTVSSSRRIPPGAGRGNPALFSSAVELPILCGRPMIKPEFRAEELVAAHSASMSTMFSCGLRLASLRAAYAGIAEPIITQSAFNVSAQRGLSIKIFFIKRPSHLILIERH